MSVENKEQIEVFISCHECQQSSIYDVISNTKFSHKEIIWFKASNYNKIQFKFP